MLPDRVSNPGPLTYESGALPIALRGPASRFFVIPVLEWCYIEVQILSVCPSSTLSFHVSVSPYIRNLIPTIIKPDKQFLWRIVPRVLAFYFSQTTGFEHDIAVPS